MISNNSKVNGGKMYRYLPDYISNSIFDVNLDTLYKKGVRGIAVDIDNTLVPMKIKEPGPRAIAWIKKVEAAGFSVVILSNARKHRAKLFMKKLGIHGIGFARKPGKSGYLKAAQHMGLPPQKCAILGDQLFTDIKGGVKVGYVTVLTKILDSNEILFVRFKRRFEKRIIDRHIKDIEVI